jgi:hypothetical protein
MSRRQVCNLLSIEGTDRDLRVFSADEILGTGVLPSDDGASLVYGWSPSAAHCGLVTRLTAGVVTGISAQPDTRCDFVWSEASSSLSPELPGLKLELPRAIGFQTFRPASLASDGSLQVLATFGAEPWFLRVRVAERTLYLLGIAEVPRAEMPVTSAETELPLVSAAVAMLTYARRYYPARSWFPGGVYANFVIDDPLLRPTYGCLRHEALARQAAALGVAATIAFIPWNARRSDPGTIELYKRNGAISICVHGNEHTDDEFCGSDLDDLTRNSVAAIQGMRLHEQLTGLPFEPVMVFAKGRFSALSLQALAKAGFLAAANSTYLADDHEGRVRLGHLLEPAVSCYGPVALFRRRGPAYLDRFRYDSILGRPLLLVEHHAYFRDGGAGFERAIRATQQIQPAAQWLPLGEIVAKTHLVRSPKPSLREVRFYSRRLRIALEAGCDYHFSKAETHHGPGVHSVTVNGQLIPYSMAGDVLRFDVPASSRPRSAEVKIGHTGGLNADVRLEHSFGRQFVVAARRYLSEFRDNHIVPLAR